MRHKPKLIEPSTVKIEQKDTGDTVFDSLLREPVKQVERLSRFCLSAQVSWGRSADPSFHEGGQGGVVTDASGYLVFHKDELDEKCVTLSRGDRVVSIAQASVDVYLTKVTYAGHHKGRYYLEIWDFVDYEPNKKANR